MLQYETSSRNAPCAAHETKPLQACLMKMLLCPDVAPQFEMETEPRNPRFSKDLLNLRKIQEQTSATIC